MTEQNQQSTGVSRRDYLRYAGVGVGAGVSSSIIGTMATDAGAQSSSDAPNVLVITGDQWRGDAMGYTGNDEIRAPHFNRLARDGMAFTQAYSNSPICAPGRACLWTGRHVHRHGVTGNYMPLPLGETTLADSLTQSSVPYRCAYVGKWHLDGEGTFGRDNEGGQAFVPPGPRRFGWGWWRGHISAHRPAGGFKVYNSAGDVVRRDSHYVPRVEREIAANKIKWWENQTNAPWHRYALIMGFVNQCEQLSEEVVSFHWFSTGFSSRTYTKVGIKI